MYTLYFSPGACSRAFHVLLEELKVPFQAKIVEVGKGEGQAPEFLAINPRGQVPVLQDGDLTLIEGAAIAGYLFDQHTNSTLMPKDNPARARAQQWFAFMNASLHPMFGSVFGAKRVSNEPAVQNAIIAAASGQIHKAYAIIEKHLEKNKFLAGDQLSIADVLMTVITGWGGAAQPAVAPGPNTARVIAAVQATPFWQAAVAREEQMKAEKNKAAA